MELSYTGSVAAPIIKTPVKSAMAVYWITPITWLIILVDASFFKSILKQNLPVNPSSIFLFSLFFNSPHIIGSTLNFFDAEYYSYYKKRLLISIALIITLASSLPILIGEELAFALYLLFTVVHFAGQKFGLCIMLTNTKGLSFQFWKFSGLAIDAIIFIDIVLGLSAKFEAPRLIKYGTLGLFIPFTAATLYYSLRSKDKIGTKAVWQNYGLVASTWFFYAIGYPFFVIFGPVVIHDITAFMFYTVHDQNRNSIQMHNILYKPLVQLGLPVLLCCPLIALSLASILTVKYDQSWVIMTLVFLNILHYYTESFAWKKGSPQRRQIVLN